MKRTTAATSLCEADCAIRGRHHPECPDDGCRGCQRRTAADGLRLCLVHAERIAEDATEAPNLHRDLALVLVRRSSDGERMSGSAISAPVPDDEVMEARIAIRSTLVHLARLIVTERGVQPPLVHRAGLAYVDTSTTTLGPWVARHADWLAAHPRAGDHSRELHAATRGPVRAMAYPAGSDRLYVGDCPLIIAEDDHSPCGTRLYQRADQPLITCTGCGTSETIEQWQRWIVGEAEAVTDAYAIATHLTVRWLHAGRSADASLIRQWAHRGHVKPVMRPDPTPGEPDRMVPLRDRRGRVQYRVSDVVAYAERLWGKP